MIMEGIQPGISANPYTAQFGQQGYLGNVAGAPFGGVIGSGVGGLFTNPAIGRQVVDGVSNPFYGDPVTAQHQQAHLARQVQLIQLAQLAQLAQQVLLAQLAQLHPQGFPGNSAGYGQPFAQISGGVPNPMVGLQAGLGIGQPGRVTPFGVDPITALQQAQLQQLQLQQQQLQQQQLQQLQQAALLAQQPQGWAGNIPGQGGAWGYPQPTGQMGGFGNQFGRPLPYQTTPYGVTATPFGVTGGYVPAY